MSAKEGTAMYAEPVKKRFEPKWAFAIRYRMVVILMTMLAFWYYQTGCFVLGAKEALRLSREGKKMTKEDYPWVYAQAARRMYLKFGFTLEYGVCDEGWTTYVRELDRTYVHRR
jgi:hypothetical protein